MTVALGSSAGVRVTACSRWGACGVQPDDFVVEEDLGFAPAGTGQHVLLKVRKRDANTQWVARELAKVCRCRPMDVGFAGLKRQAGGRDPVVYGSEVHATAGGLDDSPNL